MVFVLFVLFVLFVVFVLFALLVEFELFVLVEVFVLFEFVCLGLPQANRENIRENISIKQPIQARLRRPHLLTLLFILDSFTSIGSGTPGKPVTKASFEW